MDERETDPASTLQPSSMAALAFLGLVLLQGGHELEHIVQVFQRYVFGNPTGAGILGALVDVEPLHLAYNGIFLFLIALCFYLGGFYKELARRHAIAFWLMSFALGFEAYHFIEHIFKTVQFTDTGMNGTPGILGSFINLVWLHFAYNTIAFIPLVVVFVMDGYYRGALVAFSNAVRYRTA
jgi:hypothetical protein